MEDKNESVLKKVLRQPDCKNVEKCLPQYSPLHITSSGSSPHYFVSRAKRYGTASQTKRVSPAPRDPETCEHKARTAGAVRLAHIVRTAVTVHSMLRMRTDRLETVTARSKKPASSEEARNASTSTGTERKQVMRVGRVVLEAAH